MTLLIFWNTLLDRVGYSREYGDKVRFKLTHWKSEWWKFMGRNIDQQAISNILKECRELNKSVSFEIENVEGIKLMTENLKFL